MPSIGKRFHELRIQDADSTWRVVYRIDEDCILVLDVFSKKTQTTPDDIKKACLQRAKVYDAVVAAAKRKIAKEAQSKSSK